MCFSRNILLLLHLFILQPSSAAATRESYIVYMGAHSRDDAVEETSIRRRDEVAATHFEFLGSFMGGREAAKEAILYSYSRVVNGFAAMLDKDEVAAISKSPAVKAVIPNKAHQLHTTRSWNFLGLETGAAFSADSLWTKARFGEDTIIGNLDTGVWPESASFDDEGYGPIPARWKGICDSGVDPTFSCNRKLIGARYFNKGLAAAVGPISSNLNSPRDIDGHGAHTLSTAGGNFVPGVSVFGNGNGTAKGGSPRARVSAYKVCWDTASGSACYGADILAAFDAAIQDGVDVLSVSLGGDPVKYYVDVVAIGSYFAVKNGITVVCSAGNSGPSPTTVSNLAPWIFTVGASTMDRRFPASAVLGNGKRLWGQSLSSTGIKATAFLPLISAASAAATSSNDSAAQFCLAGSLDPNKVKGKIVTCRRGIISRVKKGDTVLLAGGEGIIVTNTISLSNDVFADVYLLPGVHLTYKDGLSLYDYINTASNPVATITTPETVNDIRPAPIMAAFSSRGPNKITSEILKPDITAPGVNIIAAYSEATSPTGQIEMRRYRTESGTSMSCPHISGIVGLLKTAYPNWSPAAIRSAIMTTATTKDNLGRPILDNLLEPADAFSYGAGHPRPNLAIDPGLVYDLTQKDYLEFFCAIGYTSNEIKIFSSNFVCPKKRPSLSNFNYPSISLPNLSRRTTVSRKVKNVGPPGTYKVLVEPPRGISMKVNPDTLDFKAVGLVKEFKVTVEATRNVEISKYLFGKLTWSDGVHSVGTPIVVLVPKV